MQHTSLSEALLSMQAVHVAVGWQQQPHSSAVQDAASCATPADVISKCSEQPAVLLVCNTQPTHPSGQFNLNPDKPLPLTCPSWIKYIHAAYKVCSAQIPRYNAHVLQMLGAKVHTCVSACCCQSLLPMSIQHQQSWLCHDTLSITCQCI